VLVNGRLALRDGHVTGDKHGRALFRSRSMPSRPMSLDRDRRVTARATLRVALQPET
jgi:hypothetical protein